MSAGRMRDEPVVWKRGGHRWEPSNERWRSSLTRPLSRGCANRPETPPLHRPRRLLGRPTAIRLVGQAPVGLQNFVHHFALHAVRDTPAGPRQDAGNFAVDRPLARRVESVAQTVGQSPEPRADAVLDRLHLVAEVTEISAMR